MIGRVPIQTTAFALSTNPDDPPISGLLPTHRYRSLASPNNVAIVTLFAPSHHFVWLTTSNRSPRTIKPNFSVFPIERYYCIEKIAVAD